MKIVLCGMMGCGKTTVGKALAIRLGLPFIDTDGLIEEEYGRISEIFARDGEEKFRELETQTARRLSLREGDCVLSVGGGFPLRRENVLFLKQGSIFVWLTADKNTLLARLLGDANRPLLQGGELEKRIEQLLVARTPIYRSVSDFAVETANKTTETIVEEIVKKLGLTGAGIE